MKTLNVPSVLTHNGTITVSNSKTKQHRTFKIKTVKNGPLKGKRVLSMLIGPDNENDFIGIAFVTDFDIVVWKKYHNTQFEKCARVLLKLEKFELDVHFSTRCRVCNKTLTTPESIESGIGPICEGRV